MTMPEMSGHSLSQETHDCIQNCLTCHSVCVQTIQHCLQLGGKHAEPSHIRLLMDCAEICQTSANFMLRGSELHQWTCATCAEVCKRCDQACREMGEDRWMLACADACKRCTESCRQMAA